MTITWHHELDSTQDVVHGLGLSGAPHGTAVAARRQRKGRGTRGRQWASGDGGLWLSVLGRGAGEVVAALSLRVGLEVAGALEAHAGLPRGLVQIKWPNDLVVADRKLGGILCEARWRGEALDWVAVGIGLNIANSLDPANAPAAHRLADLGWAGGPEPLAVPVVDAVLRALGGSGPLSPRELDAYARRDWLAGRALAGAGGGLVRGVSPAGELLVERGDGRLSRVTDAVTWSDLAPPRAGH